VPPHMYLNDTKILIGEDKKAWVIYLTILLIS
jgi:hypothetical protein